MFQAIALISAPPNVKTPLPSRPLVPFPLHFNYQLLIPMLADPACYAVMVNKRIGNVTETLYIPKEELIAHYGRHGEIRTPHAGLVDAINHVGTMSRPKGAAYEYTPRRVEVEAAAHAFNDSKYRAPHVVEVVGGTSVVGVVATLAPVQVVGTVASAAF